MIEQRLDAVILAGGTAVRLGGVSKADLDVGGVRLVDLVLGAVRSLRELGVPGTDVVVAPTYVQVPAGVRRVMEDPPGSGPLAGIEAGLRLLPDPSPQDVVVVCAVDSPGIPVWAPALLQALRADSLHASDGAIALGGEPEPFRQYLQAIYRRDRLQRLLDDTGDSRNRSVRGVLRRLDVLEVPVPADVCRDLDTPDDLDWWRGRRRCF